MGILGRIGTYVAGGLSSIGAFFVNAVRKTLGIKKKRRPPTEAIKAALRAQWLEVGKDQMIPGVEWEGEVYYDTPK